jgi:hypothetical protein
MSITIYTGGYGHNPKPGSKQYSYFGSSNYRVGQNVVAPVRHYKSGKVYNTLYTIKSTTKLADTTRRTVTDKGADMLERFTDRGIFLKEIEGTDVLSLLGGAKYKSKKEWKIASARRKLLEETGRRYSDDQIEAMWKQEAEDRKRARHEQAEANRKKKARERLAKRFSKLMKRVGNALSQGNTKPNVEQPKMVAKSSASADSNSATNIQQREDKRNRFVNNAKADTNTQNKSKVDTLPEKDNTNISSASGGFTKPNQARVDVPNRKKVKQNQDNVLPRETSEDTRPNEDTQTNTTPSAKSGKMVANSNDFNSVQSNNVSRDEIDIIFALDDLGIERTRIKQIVYKLRQNGNTKQFIEWLADNNPKTIRNTIDKIFNS